MIPAEYNALMTQAHSHLNDGTLSSFCNSSQTCSMAVTQALCLLQIDHRSVSRASSQTWYVVDPDPRGILV